MLSALFNRPHSVLVVESDDLIRDVTMRALRNAGYAAFGCRDGREARTMIQVSEFAICIFEQSIEGDMTGLDLYRWLRQRSDRLPVVITTSAGVGNVVDRVRPDPALRILAKPYGTRTLTDMLGALLELTDPSPDQA